MKEWELWTIKTNSNGTQSFMSHHGTYLSAIPDGNLSFVPHNNPWEMWHPEGQALRSHHGKYLSGREDRSVQVVDHIDSWETWTFVSSVQ
jgi:hypothetical protein